MDTYKINVRPDIKRNCILRTCIRLMFDQILRFSDMYNINQRYNVSERLRGTLEP